MSHQTRLRVYDVKLKKPPVDSNSTNASCTDDSSSSTSSDDVELTKNFIPLNPPYRCMLPEPATQDATQKRIPPYFMQGRPMEEYDPKTMNPPPLLDLRHESFFPPKYWETVQMKTRETRKSICEREEEEQKVTPGSKFIQKRNKVIEGPTPMPSGRKKRAVHRYRIIDKFGNEVLLYINSQKSQAKDPFKTEVNRTSTDVDKYSPWTPDRKNIPELGNSVPGTVLGFNTTEVKYNTKGKQKKRIHRKFRSESQNKVRQYLREGSSSLKNDKNDNNLLHPNNFYTASFPACCNSIPNIKNKRRFTAIESMTKCCRTACTCIPAVTMKDLFCCGGKKLQNVTEVSNNIITPRRVLAVRTLLPHQLLK